MMAVPAWQVLPNPMEYLLSRPSGVVIFGAYVYVYYVRNPRNANATPFLSDN